MFISLQRSGTNIWLCPCACVISLIKSARLRLMAPMDFWQILPAFCMTKIYDFRRRHHKCKRFKRFQKLQSKNLGWKHIHCHKKIRDLTPQPSFCTKTVWWVGIMICVSIQLQLKNDYFVPQPNSGKKKCQNNSFSKVL